MANVNLTTFLKSWEGGLAQALDTSIKVIFGTPTPLTKDSLHLNEVNYYNAWIDRDRIITIPFTFTGNIAPDSIITTIKTNYGTEESHPTPGGASYTDPYAGVLSIISSNSGEIQFKINDNSYNDTATLTHTIFINNQGFTCEPITIEFED